MNEKPPYSDDHIRVVFQFAQNVIHDIIVCTWNFNPDDYSNVQRVLDIFYAFTCLLAINIPKVWS